MYVSPSNQLREFYLPAAMPCNVLIKGDTAQTPEAYSYVTVSKSGFYGNVRQ
jgi:hypothetical protein